MNAIISSEMVSNLAAFWSSLGRPLRSMFFSEEVAEGEPFKIITIFQRDDVLYTALSYLFVFIVTDRLRTILTTLVS